MKKNNFKSLMQAAVLVCTPLVIASCDDVFGDADNPIPSYMSVKEADVSLVLHADSLAKATYTRTATAATGAEIVYSSDDETVATVDAKTGKITAVGNGTCNIIVEATGKDSHGNMTYQPAQSSFKVKVTDYRCRVDLIEGAEIPVYNSADSKLAEIDMSKIVKAWPANVKVTYQITNPAAPASAVVDPTDPTKIVLKGAAGTAKIKAEILAANVPAKYEAKSFKDNQVTKEFEITVKEGVAYISGYDAKGKEIRTTMFKDFNGEKYTDLSATLNAATADVTLAEGWYYLKSGVSFTHNIRVNGNVNIILGRGQHLDMTGYSILDESASKTNKLNFYAEPDVENAATPTAAGKLTALRIKDFKEVNVSGGATINSPVDAVENVTINRGSLGALTGTGNVNITEGSAGNLEGFASVTLVKSTAGAAVDANTGKMDKIGTVILGEGTSAGNLTDITTLTVEKNATIGNLKTIGTAILTEVATSSVDDVKTLTLNKVIASNKLSNITTLNINADTKVGSSATSADLECIGTANINGGEVFSNDITANALNVSGGDVTVKHVVSGFKTTKTGYDRIAGKVAMTKGKLTVNKAKTITGDVYAVDGDVEVSGGEFWAYSPYHAVSGTLTGTFEGSSDGNAWTAVSGTSKPMYLRNKASK